MMIDAWVPFAYVWSVFWYVKLGKSTSEQLVTLHAVPSCFGQP